MGEIHIHLSKIKYNALLLQQMLYQRRIRMIPVAKCMAGDAQVEHALRDLGFDLLAASRLNHISEVQTQRKDYMLIKGTLSEQAARTVQLTRISLQTELETIHALNEAAIEQGTTHQLLLMVDWKDGREGVLTYEVVSYIKQIKKMKGIDFKGLAFNFMCYRQMPPTEEDLPYMNQFIEAVERDTGVHLHTISGGNSSMLMLAMYQDMGRINELRIGEAIFRGVETAYNMRLPQLYDQAVTMTGRILEIKPRLDMRTRQSYLQAVVDIGELDTDVGDMIPMDDQLSIVGYTSDVLLINLGLADYYQIGDSISFELGYSAIAQSMHNQQLERNYIEDEGIELLIQGFVDKKKEKFSVHH
ncbi:alanine racemase [Staphylococcus muscae]|uniref:Alanine racemase n=1 Tax=Staphylococcus muscae TaxID=1294 RepID=A0A240C8F8_9STAP|nr:alanine racemase [Staphylococcus muscae]AVQ33577.1 alanine racemase [Staphylococcus muscae]PNZ04858.1 alanine racemase [Staphylococcus muscae]GGA85991.1 alanine racemase [Staphylococcus muscae]SNW03563.1 amino acid racemase [Staphylococcus muscae]